MSAAGHRLDRLQGLRFGADDYITKPFDRADVVARIRTILRGLDADADALERTVGSHIGRLRRTLQCAGASAMPEVMCGGGYRLRGVGNGSRRRVGRASRALAAFAPILAVPSPCAWHAPPFPAPPSLPRAATKLRPRRIDLGKSMTRTTQSSTEMKAG
ncbi:DNA-binding response regulator [Burkholderia multivorans]|uniref:DNA-binding response regulator n=1 Tax=Burkholderia multivorans TaxID=87883 RepID=A0A8E2S2D0_9BURK|nr:transcriptional regulator [Burkholderia multivorans]KVS12445.1 transcriptional regulator [Burkholderia multivorans]MBU9181112.1 DNA-binding response regulator [Burkholderia multivorans]MBU9237186.1 DNA-binding response regulator [Burkholderia multivorans]MBU9250272.1 DNA-binding response regulator [Burkholderia multivorans]